MTTALATDVLETLAAYEQRYGTPSGRTDLLRAALDAGRSVTNRRDLPIHVTCGVVMLGPQGDILQVRHRALGLWLLPGGHLEPDDAALVDAALREATEETGLATTALGEVRPVPIDIDIHPIPASEAKAEPEHFHADFRYVVEVVDGDIVLQADEVTDWRWAPSNALPIPGLVDRLATLRQ